MTRGEMCGLTAAESVGIMNRCAPPVREKRSATCVGRHSAPPTAAASIWPQPLLRHRPSSAGSAQSWGRKRENPLYPSRKMFPAFPKLSLWTKPFDIRYKKMAQNPCLARTWRLGGDETVGRLPRIRKCHHAPFLAYGRVPSRRFFGAVAHGPATSSRS
jgi:hypothetical protein